MEEVERVARPVQRAGNGDEIPPPSPLPGQDHGAPDDQRQKQDVPERVREVGCDLSGSATGEPLDVVEREGSAERSRSQAGDSAVQPERRHHSDRLLSHHPHKREIGEREEQDVEGIRR